jgi:putative hydrolase of the HAD superfamily
MRGVVTDWGGVMTTPILTTVRAWIEDDAIDWETYAAVMGPWVIGAYERSVPNPVHALERGRTLRGAGFPTALLSNSWGCDEYPRADFPGLFDTVVISGEVGMRKPEPEIFVHAAAMLGLEPGECVFIDDVEANITAAVACGMAGVHHTDPAITARELQALLGIQLAG